jgi:hypothetical protein
VAGRSAFQYTILRLVPRVERGERLNVGVVVHCPERRYLGVRAELDEARLAAIAPGLDPATVREHLDAIVAVVECDPAGGPLTELSDSERFGWVAAPSSTMIQPSHVHTGLSEDPADTLDHLFSSLVETRPVTDPG